MDSAIKQLEQLYGEMGPALLAYFRRQRGLTECAEDLLHDTFVCAMRGIDRLRASVSPRAYLFGIARHLSIDALRRVRPAAEQPDEIADQTPPREDGRLERLRAAIEQLPAVHQEVLLLKLRHDLSYEEMAEVLAVPVGTVRSRLHYGLQYLRQMLNPDTAVSRKTPSSHET